jgi:hypothetical protein
MSADGDKAATAHPYRLPDHAVRAERQPGALDQSEPADNDRSTTNV